MKIKRLIDLLAQENSCMPVTAAKRNHFSFLKPYPELALDVDRISVLAFEQVRRGLEHFDVGFRSLFDVHYD